MPCMQVQEQDSVPRLDPLAECGGNDATMQFNVHEKK